MTLGYLQRNENPNSSVRADGRRYWGYPTRRAEVQVIPVHTAETAPTTGSAEAIARYFTHSDRPASYHEVVDNNSWVTCLPPEATAFGARGWNANAWHLSFATYARQWGDNPEWDDAALRIGAARARKAADHFGIPIRRISKTQADRGVKGFIDHARLDPGRRTDPGSGFPWGRFLDLAKQEDGFLMALTDKQQARLYDKTLKTNHAVGDIHRLIFDLAVGRSKRQALARFKERVENRQARQGS